jgi:AGZA family xanthine/uracil permease-like MFS transporter
MAYILAVNPRILADSGGPCEWCDEGDGVLNPSCDEYMQCMEETKRKFVVATALTSMVACLIMGLWANLPIALSCGMGMNAFFTYNVVGFKSFGPLTYGSALSAVLIEGIVFFVIAISGLRFYIIKTFIPEPVRMATPAAIGAFLAHLGLQTAEGIGVVVADVATAVTLGGKFVIRHIKLTQDHVLQQVTERFVLFSFFECRLSRREAYTYGCSG